MYLLPLILIVMAGCATPSKMVVLRNLPPTISITRGSGTHCDVGDKRDTWGCATLMENFCRITLDWFATVETLIHELAHCAGHNEKTAREMGAL